MPRSGADGHGTLPCSGLAALGKRLFDIGLALAFLIPGIPLMLLLSAMILWRDGWRPIYAARRVGQYGRPFTALKFRTMSPEAPNEGVSGGDKADRITPFGAFLRRWRMDEVPQLWNVLFGQMSFVGPRPPAPEYVARFPGLYAEVLQMKPGITGMATVMYHLHEQALLRASRSPDETDAIYAGRCVPRKARLDLIYRDNWSFGLDLYLIYLTIARFFDWPGARAARLRAKAARVEG